MVRVGVLREVGFVAGFAGFFEGGALAFEAGGGLRVQDFLGEGFRGERRELCDLALKVVLT